MPQCNRATKFFEQKNAEGNTSLCVLKITVVTLRILARFLNMYAIACTVLS